MVKKKFLEAKSVPRLYSPTLSPCKSKSTHPNYNSRPVIDVSRQELSITGLKLNFGGKTKVLPYVLDDHIWSYITPCDEPNLTTLLKIQI